MTRNYLRLLLVAALLLSGWASAQSTINPSADAFVRGGKKADENFGARKRLKAQTDTKAARNFDSYLKFDMSALPPFSAVTLRLYAKIKDAANPGVPITVYAVADTGWDESTITWNNKPPPGAALASVNVLNTSFAWYEFDVTSYLDAERAAGRNVVSLALRAPTTSSRVLIRSRQAKRHQPQLLFTPALANIAPSVNLTAPLQGSTYSAPATIALSANASDADGTIDKVEFFHGGSNLIATLSSAPYTFDWSNVAPGSYTLSARATDDTGTSTTSSSLNVTVAAQQALYYVHADHLNTPRVITDANQVVVWRWDNEDPFGANIASEDPDGNGLTVTCNLRFPGQYFDKETGNHYNYFRDYNPSTGRYIESDPIGLRAGLNTYGYVAGDPVRLSDPLGLLTASGGVGASGHAVLVGGGVGAGATVDERGVVCVYGDLSVSFGLGIFGGVGFTGEASQGLNETGRTFSGSFFVEGGPGIVGGASVGTNEAGEIDIGKVFGGAGVGFAFGVRNTFTWKYCLNEPEEKPCPE